MSWFFSFAVLHHWYIIPSLEKLGWGEKRVKRNERKKNIEKRILPEMKSPAGSHAMRRNRSMSRASKLRTVFPVGGLSGCIFYLLLVVVACFFFFSFFFPLFVVFSSSLFRVQANGTNLQEAPTPRGIEAQEPQRGGKTLAQVQGEVHSFPGVEGFSHCC